MEVIEPFRFEAYASTIAEMKHWVTPTVVN